MPTLSTALKVTARELRGGLQGFRVFFGCLILGVGAIAWVQSVSGSVASGLHKDGRSILGGDIALRMIYSGVSDEQLTYLQRTTKAITHFVEMRGMARREDEEANTLIELKAVDDRYPLFGSVELRDGGRFVGSLAYRSGVWGAAVDATVLDRLHVNVGDRIVIGDYAYEIRGVIEREPDRAGAGGNFGLGSRILVSLESLPETGLDREGSLVYHQYRLQLAPDISVDRYLVELDTAFPDASWRVRDFRNPAYRVKRMARRVAVFLTLVGLTALLIGGIGVSNAVRAYLDGKVRTIATLKCLGASGRTVFQIYMAQVLVLSCGAVAIGVVSGAAASWVTATLLEDTVPTPMHADIYPRALGLAALCGFLTTVTFAMWPVARAQEIPAAALFRDTVVNLGTRPAARYIGGAVVSGALLCGLAVATADNKAFASWFIAGFLLAVVVFRIVAWLIVRVVRAIPHPRHPGVRLALVNLCRPGNQTANVIVSIGLGMSVLVAIVLIQGNLSRQVQESIPKSAPAFFFLDIQADQIDSFADLVGGVHGARGLQQIPYLRGRIISVNETPAEDALVDCRHAWMIRGDRGFTYSATAPQNAEIIAGEWWAEDYDGPPLLSIHEDVTEAFGIGVGDTITFNILGRNLTGTVANVRDLEWRTMQLNFAIMFSPNPLRYAPHTFIATIGATPDAELRLQHEVTQSFPNITTVRIKEALDIVHGLLRKIGGAVRSIASITLIAGTLVLAGVIAAGHRRRVYESVVLKVLGATRRDALRAFVLEYGLLAVLTAAIAAVVGTVTAWAVTTQVMNSEWAFIPSMAAITLVLCTAAILALGYVGTWRALGQKAAPLLRNE